MTSDPKRIEVGKPLAVLVALVGTIAVLFALFAYLDRRREQEILDTYTKETQQYIVQHAEGLKTIFTEVFPKEPCTTELSYQCVTVPEEAIATRSANGLRDFSSTMFITLVRGSKVGVLRLSGEAREGYVYPREREHEVLRLLRGEALSVPWNDYFYELPGKEIIVPVKSDSGEVLGAIVRGVIEE